MEVHVQVALAGADGIARQQQPFENLVRVVLHEQPVLVAAGLVLATVTDDVFALARRFHRELPLAAHRKRRAAATPQPARRDLGQHSRGIARAHDALPRAVAALVLVGREALRPALAGE